MKYFICIITSMTALIISIVSGNLITACMLAAGSSVIICFVNYFYDVKRNRELDELTELLLKIQDGNGLPPLKSLSGRTGIVQSEIYKLVTLLRERAGNASREKKYLSDMLSDISHQVKTPLAAITIMTDLLSEPDLPEEKRQEFTHNIEKQTEKITWLIRNLLILSQLEASVLKLKKEDIASDELIEKACQPLEVMAEIKNVELKKEIYKEKIRLTCDIAWTSEAVSNIVKNCIEHTPEGGKVTIKTSQTNLGTTITVSDTGPGISAGDMPHIFERFYKGKNSTKDSVGIGLAIAKQIMLSQNGTINAVNTDEGCCFELKLYNTGR